MLSAYFYTPLSPSSPFPIHFPLPSTVSKCVFPLSYVINIPLLLVLLSFLMQIFQYSFTPLLAMPDEALTIFSFLSPNNHVLLLPPLLETRICIVFSFLCVNKHYKKITLLGKFHTDNAEVTRFCHN